MQLPALAIEPSMELTALFHVLEPLLAPTLSLDSPDPVFYQGESLELHCSAPGTEEVTGYRFYRERQDRTSEELPSPQGAPSLELRSQMGEEGPYTCRYWRRVSGQEILSIDSNKVYVTILAAPPAPVLSLDPLKPVYLPGEPVHLSCSAPRAKGLTRYGFFKSQPHQVAEELPPTWQGTQLEIQAAKGNEGPYTCRYWSRVSGREIPSELSQPITISVMEPLLAPTLSLESAYPVFYQGESLELRCSAPGDEGVTGYRFYRERRGWPPEELPSPHGAAQLELTAQMGEEGPYTCRYWRRVSGQEIPSGDSNKAYVTVLAAPPAPTLSLDPLHPVYLSGEWVTLSCLAPWTKEVVDYRFYKGWPEQVIQELTLTGGTLRLKIQAAMEHEGPYTCRYWSRESGREIPSGLSQPIAMHVTEPPPAPRLTLAPWHPVYVPGERVTLRCLAPQGQEVAGYRFLGQRGGMEADRVPDPLRGAWLELTAAMGQARQYVCMYWMLRSGRKLPSKQSQPISISMTDHPRKPSVSVSPEYPAYVPEDRVEIHCSAPPSASPMQYGLYKNGEPFTSPSGNASSWQIGLHVNGTRNTTWAFFCTYGQLIQGRTVTSHISDPISLAVFPTPAHPSLQLSPHYPMYLTGESVTVECIIPHEPYVAQNHTVLRDGQPLLEPSGPRLTLNVTPSDSGNYSCGYSTELHGRHLHSPHSQLVLLGVTDPPPHPLLSVDPPSGAVSEGHPLNITCAAPRDTGVRRFHFYKDGAEIITGDAGPEISATEPRNSSMNVSVLSIPRANANTTGEFTCGYKENMGGRWVLSPRSEAVNVTVTDWSLLIFQVAVGGGAALALALMLMVCLCRRKKKAGRRLSTSYWKSMELRHSRIMRQSEDISGVNMEGPGSGKAAVGAVPPKCQKGDEDADSGAEFEFPELDPTYSLLTFSSSTFHQCKGLPASPEPIYELPPPPPSPDPCRQ